MEEPPTSQVDPLRTWVWNVNLPAALVHVVVGLSVAPYLYSEPVSENQTLTKNPCSLPTTFEHVKPRLANRSHVIV